jgi:hypothetical protein
MKLHEIATPNQHKKIKDWIDLNCWAIGDYTIRPDGIVDVNGDAGIRNTFQGNTIAIQFGKVSGKFGCAGTLLTSLKGMPQYCYGEYYSVFQTKIKSLSGIDKIIKHITGVFYCNEDVTHILGLLLIPGLKGICIDDDGPIDQIMNKYVGTGDILSAQDELIDAGFTDQARL